MGVLFQGTVEQIVSTIETLRCATVIVNAKFMDNSMSLFNNKLAWLTRNISFFFFGGLFERPPMTNDWKMLLTQSMLH